MNINIDSEKLKRVLFSCRQESLGDAIIADISDAVPIAGDIGNAFRFADAAKRKDVFESVAQGIDLIGGLPPIIGEVFDIVTPTNTISYLLRKGK